MRPSTIAISALTISLFALGVSLTRPATAHGTSPSELPVGDGKVTTSPLNGNVFSCNQTFRANAARHVGDWFHGNTWNPLEKPHVLGREMWPSASFSIAEEGNRLSVESNGLPVGEPTGTFPIARNDPAYQYDTNPNPITAQNLAFVIPSNPEKATQPSCLSMGMIGFTLTGVAFYSALDDAGRDAAAHEVQDLCDGHPQGKGQYHYHSTSPCLPNAERNKVVGWALDGYPILGMVDASGNLLTNADLDDCHGRNETIKVDGRTYDYGYRLTREYPYVMGCFTGEVLRATKQSIRQSMGPPKSRTGRGAGAGQQNGQQRGNRTGQRGQRASRN